jgi:hypothetical protein
MSKQTSGGLAGWLSRGLFAYIQIAHPRQTRVEKNADHICASGSTDPPVHPLTIPGLADV